MKSIKGRYGKVGLWLLLLVALALLSSACLGKDGEQEFAGFWAQFRTAVLNGDEAAVASMTRFPLEVRGPADSDPVETYGLNEFEAIYQRLISQELYEIQSDELDVATTTMRETVERTVAVGEENLLAPDVARVDQFMFELTPEGWRFTFAFLEE